MRLVVILLFLHLMVVNHSETDTRHNIFEDANRNDKNPFGYVYCTYMSSSFKYLPKHFSYVKLRKIEPMKIK